MAAETDILEIGFAGWLSTLPAYAALADNRVYPQVCTAPGGPTYPLSVYRRLSTDRGTHLKGGSGNPQARLELVFWGEPGDHGYRQAKLLANATRPHLLGWGDESGVLKWGDVTVARCLVEDESDVLEDRDGNPMFLAQGVRFLLSVRWRESVLTLPRSE